MTTGTASVITTATTTITKKIENAIEGLPTNCFNHLHNRVLLCAGSKKGKGKENAIMICDYIFSLRSETNPSDNYRKDIIKLLCKLSMFFVFNDNNNNNNND